MILAAILQSVLDSLSLTTCDLEEITQILHVKKEKDLEFQKCRHYAREFIANLYRD